MLTEPDGNQLDALLEQLSLDQKRWLIERMRCASDAEACRRVGINRGTIYDWRNAGAPIDQALELLANDGIHMARSILRSAIPGAALVLADALDDRDKRLRQAAALEILDRAGQVGKPAQKQEVSGSFSLTIAGSDGIR